MMAYDDFFYRCPNLSTTMNSTPFIEKRILLPPFSKVSNNNNDTYELLLNFQLTKKIMDETISIGSNFARGHIILGILALLLNLTILFVLIIKRRFMFKNVFYILIFNFALIDCLKGVCLIAYASRLLKSGKNHQINMSIMKFDQYVTVIFRFCNLATILNLLLITLNEYVFIKHPFLYNRWVKRKLALFFICLNWVLCLSFTIGSSTAKAKARPSGFFVSHNYTRSMKIRTSYDEVDDDTNVREGWHIINHQNREMFHAVEGVIFSSTKTWYLDANSDQNIVRFGSNKEMDVHYIFSFTIIFFCLLCLMVVLICYTAFIRIIRAIRLADSRLYSNANRASDHDVECAGQRYSSNPLDHHRPSVEERKIKGQLLKRNKYAIVIGSVILVYTTYLLTYSAIQVFQYLHLSQEPSGGNGDTVDGRRSSDDVRRYQTSGVVRWSLLLLLGLHSIFQPLCYFRMREFRRFVVATVCCCCAAPNAGNEYYTTSFALENMPPTAAAARRASAAVNGRRKSSAAYKRADSVASRASATRRMTTTASAMKHQRQKFLSVESTSAVNNDDQVGGDGKKTSIIVDAIRNIFKSKEVRNEQHVVETPLILRRTKNDKKKKHTSFFKDKRNRNEETRKDQEVVVATTAAQNNYPTCPVIYCNEDEM
uniref:G-protein coupled receptors family 1 profile domain-containing protein n=1 Tax=Romanomermis culicivorax TaxID=13658 RepID=A0A915HMC0_ROMCU